MKKKLTALLLAGAMAMASIGTGTVAFAADYTKAGAEGEVVVGIAADPENMGPWAGMSQGRIAVLFSVYEYLITRSNGQAEGVLAKSWEQVDGQTYKIELYEGIHDTAGNPLTANDVKYSFESAQATQNYSKLEPVEEITVVDDYNLEFKFNKVLEMGEFESIMMECAIVTQAAYEASADQMATDPVGTTAYAVTEYTPGSKLVLEDTGNYWQTDESLVANTSKHNIPKITMTVITEASQHTVALQTNAVDITNGVPDTDIAKFQEGGEYAEGHAVSVVPDNLTYDLQFNMSDDSFFKDDLNLRLAVAYAINCEELNLGVFNGNGWVVKDFANSNYEDYVAAWDDEEYFPYDVEAAKEYLAQSNYDGQTMRIMYIQNAYMDLMGPMIQAYLGEIGIPVELIGYDFMMANSAQYDSTAFDAFIKTGGSTDYIVNQWKLCWDARDFTQVTGGTANFVQDDKLQELFEAAISTETHSEETLIAFHDYLKEQCYGFGMVQGPINIAHSAYLSEVALDCRNQILPGACVYAE